MVDTYSRAFSNIVLSLISENVVPSAIKFLLMVLVDRLKYSGKSVIDPL